MKSALIVCDGWIGDILFTLSIPDKLRKEKGYDVVDLQYIRPQVHRLLQDQSCYNNTFLGSVNKGIYTSVYTMPVIEDKSIAPTVQYQKACGIINTNTEFNITPPKNKVKVEGQIIAYQGDWDYRRWAISPEEIKARRFNTTGLVPYFRSTRPDTMSKVLHDLMVAHPTFNFVKIDPFLMEPKDPRGYSLSPELYYVYASIISQAKLFLGAEGGLCNLAAGLGIRSIITTDHLHMMFGETGVMSQCSNIQLGPEKLFPNMGHVNLDPFMTNDEIYTYLNQVISKL